MMAGRLRVRSTKRRRTWMTQVEFRVPWYGPVNICLTYPIWSKRHKIRSTSLMHRTKETIGYDRRREDAR